MNYIDSSVIVDDLKNSLSSYFASNKVDESILPRVIRRCVGQMGLKILPEKSVIVELENYKTELPEDFNKAILVLLCSGRAKYVKNALKSELEQRIVTELNLCESQFDVCTDECGNMTKLIQKTKWDRFEYDEFTMLCPSKDTKPYCAEGCFNFRSRAQNAFEISEKGDKKFLMSTEPCGFVYVEYIAELEHEEGFLIPNNETIKTWIHQELLKECFKYMWNNGEEVMQRMQYADKEVVVWEERARQIYQRSEMKDYYNMKARLQRRFSAMENWMINSSVYRPRG